MEYRVIYVTSEVFSDGLISVLGTLESKAVVLWMDDYWFSEAPDRKLFELAVKEVVEGGARYVRLAPSEYVVPYNLQFNRIRIDSYYIVSCQLAVWNREYLKSFLRKGETAWDFEDQALKRLTSNQNFCLRLPAVKVGSQHFVRRGKWTDEAYEFCRKEGIDVK